MKITAALRLTSIPRIAIVGGGGKTTTLFALARDSAAPVIVAATAHMSLAQTALADQHFFINDPADLIAFNAGLPDGVTFFTGPANAASKTTGLTTETVRAVQAVADRQGVPLFIEADGSRGRPLKAPAEHEPPIPDFVEMVIYVVGLTGLGGLLSEATVHRPDRFARLAGLALGEAVTPDAVARVLLDPDGGLKNVPSTARRVALLNQADTPELQAQAQCVARQLLPTYQAVVIAALKHRDIFAVHEPVAGIILAAGAAKRLGQPKPLLMWRGEPFIRHVARTALAAGLSPVVMIGGVHTADLQAAVAGWPVTVVYNADWEAGQSTSVRSGLRALPPETGAAIFLLADQPHSPIELVRGLIERHAQALAPIVAPLIDGRRGNPVLFDRSIFDDLQSLQGDVGGRAVLARHAVTYLPWPDAGLLLDVDTPGDYQRLVNLDRC